MIFDTFKYYFSNLKIHQFFFKFIFYNNNFKKKPGQALETMPIENKLKG